MNESKAWIGPLTGVIAVAFIVAGILVAGEGPDATEESAQAVVEFYVDGEGAQFAASFLLGIGAVALVFFGGWLRTRLRGFEGERGMLSAVAFGGALFLAVSTAVAATINVALADTADDIDPVAVQAINAIVWNYYIPLAAGMAILTLSAGISALRHRSLPAWLGWIAVVIGVLSLTPVGYFASLVGLAWIVVVGGFGIRGLDSSQTTEGRRT